MLVFSRPLALVLFLIFPTFFLLKYFRIIGHFKIYLNLLKWGETASISKNSSYLFLSFLYKACLYLAISSSILTIAEPCVYKTIKTYSGKGTSIMFLLDISPSMAAKDIDEKTRFFVAKKIIDDVVKTHKGASFALSTFAQHAALIILPTIDISTFLFRLNLVELGELGEGTSIGESIALAISNIRQNPASIVLLTDGENNTGRIDISLISKVLKQRGIELYIVQLGKEGYAPLEYFDKKNQKQYTGSYLTKPASNELKFVAENTTGKYVSIRDDKDIQTLFKELAEISHSEVPFRHTQKEDLSFYFIMLSLILSITSWIIARIIIGLTND